MASGGGCGKIENNDLAAAVLNTMRVLCLIGYNTMYTHAHTRCIFIIPFSSSLHPSTGFCQLTFYHYEVCTHVHVHFTRYYYYYNYYFCTPPKVKLVIRCTVYYLENDDDYQQHHHRRIATRA